ARPSEWASPADIAAPVGEVPRPDEFAGGPVEPRFDPDAVDTEPTRIEHEHDHDHEPEREREPEPTTGRHAKVDLDEPLPSRPAIHLALDDPHQMPDGYPIKADTKSGRYWSPNSGHYPDAVAEIWFASEEFARANGFVSAD
ncbi:MAG: hypothetical protein JO152_10120, partial [Mycobacteriaceae bacterium]|nr:hypothetical protein [Mycobacteriaceae bacterium]